jgi:hypothetical protein
MDLRNAIPVESYIEAAADIDTGAYNEIVAATVKACSCLKVYNGTDVPVLLATGAAAAEEDIPEYVGPGQETYVNRAVAAGTRLACKAGGANATSGYLTVTLMQ